MHELLVLVENSRIFQGVRMYELLVLSEKTRNSLFSLLPRISSVLRDWVRAQG